MRPGGPYHVTQAPLVRMRPVVNAEGDPVAWERGPEIDHPAVYDLCRCGRSATQPFCDGSESRDAWSDSEVADRRPSAERRREFGSGPVVLTDDRSLCSGARFCSVGKDSAWTLAMQTEDPERRLLLTEMVARCPSGRLEYRLVGSPMPVEEELSPEIAVTKDGPLWVRGGIPIEAAGGFRYEVRNRVTLCRCGASGNKPFCDGSHIRVGFRDARAND
ncbi:CDGSH iron-sulfur domain-containing protein [soil metagenome]